MPLFNVFSRRSGPHQKIILTWEKKFFFNCASKEPEKKKKRQESKDERWARLDKRIERARARHELAHLGMGTIFLALHVHGPKKLI